MNLKPIPFDAAQAEQWLDQTANCTIPDRDLLSLMRMLGCAFPEPEPEQPNPMQKRLDLALNSYCHIYRIGHRLKANVIDDETAAKLKEKVETGEGLTDREVRLLAKAGSDKNAELLLWGALMGTLDIVEDE